MAIKSIKITGDQSTNLQGEAPAGTAKLEALDLSFAASNRLSLDDYQPVATVDASGKFSIPMSQLPDDRVGDYVRIRALGADGSVKGLVTIRLASASAVDATNAPFVGRRLALYDDGTGNAAIVAADDDKRPVSEPFASVKLTNTRTGHSKQVKLDADGLFPDDFSIAAIAGDKIAFAVSDGVSNTDFAVSDPNTWSVVGKIAHANDLTDPAPLKDSLDKKGRSKVGMQQFKGQLFVDGVSEKDVGQRYIGDCYLAAAFASIAHTRPDAIMDMIRKRPDGNYDIVYKLRDSATGKYQEKTTPVDTDFYVDSSGEPIYGGDLPLPEPAPETMEIWFALVEKGWAKLHRTYETIGNGGEPSTIFSAVFGKAGISLDITTADSLWTRITKSVDAKKPSALCTGDDASVYDGTGLHEDHCYSILDYRDGPDGRQVQLRNPWGNDEPGDDGDDDGIFWMPVEQVAKLYTGFFSVR